VSKKGAPRRYTVQRYIDEAAKEPFVLWLDEERSVTIPQPSGRDMENLGAMSTAKDLVATFAETEEDADLIMEVFADAPAGAIRGFAKDVQEHFGLGG
jgi:hypothetical protein